MALFQAWLHPSVTVMRRQKRAKLRVPIEASSVLVVVVGVWPRVIMNAMYHHVDTPHPAIAYRD
jgi:hypothetical protein